MRLSDSKTYWKKAADNNAAIQATKPGGKHFCTFTVEDALSSLKTMDFPVLALELPSFALRDGNSDNVRIDNNGAILILKPAPAGDKAKIEQAYLDTEPIAFQMLSKMMNDRRKANDDGVSAPEKYMKELDLNKVKIVDVGPVFENLYGWRLDYAFNSTVNLTLDESQWLPNTETKWTI